MKKISDFNNKTLLLVDDDGPFRERLARAMEKKGFQVSQAEGVKKGIEAVKQEREHGVWEHALYVGGWGWRVRIPVPYRLQSVWK